MSAVFEWRDAIRRPPPGHELKPTDRLVALVLSFYMDRDTLENARPGPARLAAETGLAPRTVKLALQSLASSGWIVQTAKGGTRKGGTEKVASTYSGSWPAGMRVPAPPPETRAERAPVQEIHGSTRAGDARAPVHLTTDTRAADAHYLVPDLEQDLVCVADLAASKLAVPKSVDTHGQLQELKVKTKALVAIHGEDAVRTALDGIDESSVPFAGQLDKILRATLPSIDKGPACDRCNGTGQTTTGSPCGCPATAGKRRAS